MDLKKLCREAHKNAVEKGFYNCPDCHGSGWFNIITNGNGDSECECKCAKCKGEGIYKNIGELLSDICEELYEAKRAYQRRKLSGKIDNLYGIYESYLRTNDKEIKEEFLTHFLRHVKDTFEDELADVFIRLFDMCGYFGIELKIEIISEYIEEHKNIGSRIYRISHELPMIEIGQSTLIFATHKLNKFYTAMLEFCKEQKIDIEKHINLKMAYNKTRPRKHGKDY